jgi:outer membrane protein assembly factor BamD
MKHRRALPLFLWAIGGCSWFSSPPEEPFLSYLNVDKKILEATEGSLEKSYDALTLIQRAEAFYRDRNFIEAVGEYQRFLELHPLHRLAAYVQFKLGMSYFHQIRDIDQDQKPLEKALQSFLDLVAKYPASPYVDQAKEKITYCRDRLAEYQFYVGFFYFKKGSYPAAIHRFHRILQDYPDAPMVVDALYYLGFSYELSGAPEDAVTRYQDLVERYPKSRYEKKALERLSSLQENRPHTQTGHGADG